jgi:hypothetical protein
VDPLIVATKLEALRRCIKRIEERRPPSADTLRASPDLQDILSVNITRDGLEDFRQFAAAVAKRL